MFTPVIFVAGASGAGKSFICQKLKEELRLTHIDVDRKPFEHYGLQEEWDEFSRQLNSGPLLSTLRNRITVEGRPGVVLSFPNSVILTLDQIECGKRGGICTVVLWATPDLCKMSRRERTQKRRRKFHESRYDRLNQPVFDTYGLPGYADVRLEVFSPEGARVAPEQIVSIIRQRAGF